MLASFSRAAIGHNSATWGTVPVLVHSIDQRDDQTRQSRVRGTHRPIERLTSPVSAMVDEADLCRRPAVLKAIVRWGGRLGPVCVVRSVGRQTSGPVVDPGLLGSGEGWFVGGSSRVSQVRSE